MVTGVRCCKDYRVCLLLKIAWCAAPCACVIGCVISRLVYMQNNYTHKMGPREKANILDYGGQIIVPLDFFIAEPGMQFGLACVILTWTSVSHASRLSHSKNMAAII